jgi:excisionase family DNA binding protein
VKTERLLSRDEVARFLGIPKRTLDSWAYRGEGPTYIRIGRWARYRKEDLEAWLESREAAR